MSKKLSRLIKRSNECLLNLTYMAESNISRNNYKYDWVVI